MNMRTLVWVAPENRRVRTGECVERPTDHRIVPKGLALRVCTLIMCGQQVAIATPLLSDSIMTC